MPPPQALNPPGWRPLGETELHPNPQISQTEKFRARSQRVAYVPKTLPSSRSDGDPGHGAV